MGGNAKKQNVYAFSLFNVFFLGSFTLLCLI